MKDKTLLTLRFASARDMEKWITLAKLSGVLRENQGVRKFDALDQGSAEQHFVVDRK